MTFTNQYLSFSEYQELGGKIVEQPFKNLEYRAEKEIDKLTFNRLRKIVTYPQELKMCVYELISILNGEGNSSYISETVGNYSKTKRSSKDIEEVKNSIIEKYLSDIKVDNIPVLYRGADVDGN